MNLDDGGWQRAKILEIEEDTANVFLGDHGDDDTVDLDKIKILEPQFRKLPAQVSLSVTFGICAGLKCLSRLVSVDDILWMLCKGHCSDGPIYENVRIQYKGHATFILNFLE